MVKWMLKDMDTKMWTGLFYWIAVEPNNSIL